MKKEIVVNVLRVLKFLLKVIPYVITLLDKSGDRVSQYIENVNSDNT